MDGIIELHGITKSFGKQTVLNNIHFSVNKGEIVSLLGPSGCGKTTLIKIMMGLVKPTEGSVSILHHKLPHHNILYKIGYMEQSDALYDELTAYDNMQYFSAMYGLHWHSIQKQVHERLELVNLLEHAKKPVMLFSGGMRRRLSLAITLLHNPDILILDEPTVGIDPVLRQSFWEEFDLLKKQGKTILLSTHLMDEVERCDKVCMLRDGDILDYDSPALVKKKSGTNSIEEAFIHYSKGVSK